MQPLEFYDPSQPRSKDGKWSKWGSQSANPAKVGERPRGAAPWGKDDNEPYRVAQKLFDHTLSDGTQSRVAMLGDVIRHEDGTPAIVTVHGKLVNPDLRDEDGRPVVGTFTRQIRYDQNTGEITVQHESLGINAHAQGRGIGNEFVEASLRAYDQAGISEITVHAAGTVGRYNWARQGFRIYPEYDRQSAIAQMLAHVNHMMNKRNVMDLTKEQQRQVHNEIVALKKANDAGEDVQPRHIAAIGKSVVTNPTKDGSLEWPGKVGMLTGDSWDGHYVINREPGTETVSMLDVIEFYDPSQPRATDGKWKRWSGVSADPATVGPIRARFPSDDEWLRDEGFDSEEAFLTSWYAHDLPDGYRSSVLRVSPALDKFGGTYGPSSDGPMRWKIEGKILTPSGHEAGRFKRKIEYNRETRELSVTHDILVIDTDHQGKGLADAFNAQSVAKYQEYGVRDIKLHAAMNVGGYAWARQGFRIFPEGERQNEITQLLKRADHALEDADELTDENRLAIRKELKALKKANADGEDVQPIHIAALGEKVQQYEVNKPGKDPYRSWVGKSALLGSGWIGHYVIDPKAPIVGSSTCLHHASLRPKYGANIELLDVLGRRMGWTPLA